MLFKLFLISIASYASAIAANDTLFPNQFLSGDGTLVSSNQRFEIGFFGSIKMLDAREIWGCSTRI